jgi:serine/threonine protein kinase
MKPENVLIFRNDKRYTAKVTDFGLSTRNTVQDQLVFVGGTWPWTAPEHKGSQFTVAQIKNMDIFSYGMLVFWILFKRQFSDEVSPRAESCQTEQCFESEQQYVHSMTVMNQFKHDNELNLLAKKLVRNEQSIDDVEVRVFEKFFDSALSCDPEDRADALEIFFPFKEQ